jgi:serine/threonine-protein phosphatase 2A regulatory subunit A
MHRQICADLIKQEDDEVLFAIAEELGEIYKSH